MNGENENFSETVFSILYKLLPTYEKKKKTTK